MASTSAACSCTKQLESGEARKSGLGPSVVKLNKKKLFQGGEMSYATRLHLFGDRDLTEDREKFKTVSNHAKYRMEGVKERYGKAATEEVEYEEGEVEYDRAGGVINCRETVVPVRRDDTSFVINNRRYTHLWRYFWLDEYSCGKGCIECAARIGNHREGIPEEMPRLIGKKEKK